MARPLRIDYPGAMHHIIFRGNRKQEIFRDEKDYLKFLELLKINKEKNKVRIYAYCLMKNHCHLLAETGDVHISRFMAQLLTNYVQYFNRRWGLIGHLLQDRYKSILVDKNSYLITLIRYIHLNPIKAGLCKNLSEYLWSSYIEYHSKERGIIDYELLIKEYGNQIFSDEIIEEKEYPTLKKYGNLSFYGDENFVNSVLEKIGSQKRKNGSLRGKITINDVEEYLKNFYNLSLKDREIRDKAIVILRDRLHMTFREIGDVIGVNFKTVHRIYKSSKSEKILKEFDKFIGEK